MSVYQGYYKQNSPFDGWHDGKSGNTPWKAAALNVIETGIETAHSELTAHQNSGDHDARYYKLDGTNTITGQIVSTYNSGAPLVVASTTKVANLNVEQVDGCDAGTSANNVLKLDGSGKVPLANIYTGTGNGLDADKWDGKDMPSNVLGYLKNDGAGNLSWVNVTTAYGTGFGNITLLCTVPVGTTSSVYQAATDLIVLMTLYCSGVSTFYTDANANPTTGYVDTQYFFNWTMVVKKGNYYKLTYGTGGSTAAIINTVSIS